MIRFRNYFLIFFATFALTAISCSKDDDGEPSGTGFTPGEAMMTAKIDGENFVATNIESVKGVNEGSVVVMIGGEDETERQFWIAIHNFTGTGTYEVLKDGDEGDSFASILYWEQENQEGWWGMDGGKVVVSGYLPDERIKGTFQFELDNLNETRRSVTEGKFEVKVVLE